MHIWDAPFEADSMERGGGVDGIPTYGERGAWGKKG